MTMMTLGIAAMIAGGLLVIIAVAGPVSVLTARRGVAPMSARDPRRTTRPVRIG
jgi:hypothetical protein